MSFEGYPIGVGPQYEGERVRAKEMFIELAGPKAKGFELCQVKPAKSVKDGQVKLVGPDLKDLKAGASVPFGMYLEIAGSQLEEDLEAVIERRFHDFANYIQGFLHLNQRYTCWMRLSKKSYEKGLNSLSMIGEILIKLFKAEFNIIEKAQLTMYTDPKEIDKAFDHAMEVYTNRDKKVRGMTDEDVDVFYACTLCASFAPKHACAITPNRMSLCGAINWFDARAAAKVDPKGPIYKVEKGTCIDELAGEYEGINAMIKNASLGEIDRVFMYSGLEFPHTSCGCFEAIAFYIPEVEGYGVVDRDYKGAAVNGLPFSTMANSTGGGNQVEGFNGISIEYMRSPRYFQFDGGWERFVWLPNAIKGKILEYIPENLRDSIATENEATDIGALKDFLKSKDHPVVKRWVDDAEEDEDEDEEQYGVPQMATTQQGMAMPQMQMMMPGTGGMNIKIIFENVRIHADSVTFKKVQSKKGKK